MVLIMIRCFLFLRCSFFYSFTHLFIYSLHLVQSNVSRSMMLGLSLDATIAFSIGIQRIANLEAETTGVQFGSLFMSIQGYSVMDSIIFMLVDSVIYYFLGRYFDQVIPKEFGLTQPWNFLFTKEYWKGEMVQDRHQKIEKSPDERWVIND